MQNKELNNLLSQLTVALEITPSLHILSAAIDSNNFLIITFIYKSRPESAVVLSASEWATTDFNNLVSICRQKIISAPPVPQSLENN